MNVDVCMKQCWDRRRRCPSRHRKRQLHPTWNLRTRLATGFFSHNDRRYRKEIKVERTYDRRQISNEFFDVRV